MLRLVRFAVPAAVLAAWLAPSASAARVPLPETLTTAHFQVHYAATPNLPWRINVMKAGEIGAIAERAYATYLSWGYPAPLNDGDGLYDIYVVDEPDGTWGGAFADNPFALSSSAHIELDALVGLDEHKIAHLVFHLFQDALWNPLDPWMREAGAEWASFRLLGFPAMMHNDESDKLQPLSEYLGKPDMPLDCAGDRCGDTRYEQGGYPRWAFLTYLGERYGTGVVKEIHDQGPSSGDASASALGFLTNVLAAKGATLGDVFGDWTVAQMTGTYTSEGLKGTKPLIHATVVTGMAAGTLPAQKVAVNHLATRYLSFKRGGSSSGVCHAATLTIRVTIPAGVAARPYFYWTAPGSTPIPLAASGASATLSVPWDTCTWKAEGLLSLPNPSPTSDGAEFTVSGSLTVDSKTIVTSTPPPASSYTGPTVGTPDADEAPAIAVYGPELLRVSRKKRTLRLVVFSSGAGRLEAAVGALQLGTRTLRAGNNDLRFTVPRTVLRSLAVRAVVTLTSMSPSGDVGATVTRQIKLAK